MPTYTARVTKRRSDGSILYNDATVTVSENNGPNQAAEIIAAQYGVDAMNDVSYPVRVSDGDAGSLQGNDRTKKGSVTGNVLRFILGFIVGALSGR